MGNENGCVNSCKEKVEKSKNSIRSFGQQKPTTEEKPNQADLVLNNIIRNSGKTNRQGQSMQNYGVRNSFKDSPYEPDPHIENEIQKRQSDHFMNIPRQIGSMTGKKNKETKHLNVFDNENVEINHQGRNSLSGYDLKHDGMVKNHIDGGLQFPPRTNLMERNVRSFAPEENIHIENQLVQGGLVRNKIITKNGGMNGDEYFSDVDFNLIDKSQMKPIENEFNTEFVKSTPNWTWIEQQAPTIGNQ